MPAVVSSHDSFAAVPSGLGPAIPAVQQQNGNVKASAALSQILDLLAYLFKRTFYVHNDPRDRRIVAFRARGVDLAVHLLQKEIELATYRPSIAGTVTENLKRSEKQLSQHPSPSESSCSPYS